MKKLFTAILLLAGISFWACQKEYSYETTIDAASTGSWEFKDSVNTTYSGSTQNYSVDTTYATALMNYTGVTADRKGLLTIGIDFPTSRPATGTYSSLLGQVDFSYSVNARTTFLAESGNQYLTENITVVISQITDTSVTGTFSGTAVDSTRTKIKIIKEGKFTYKKRAVATTPTATASTGSLGTTTDTCTGAVLSGTYKKGVAMTATNTVTVTANVTATGTYTIYSDTLKGIYFRNSASFATTGAQSVVIAATGTPTDTGTVRFRIRYGTSSCTFQVKIDSVAGTVVTPTGDYFPTTTGSNWSYSSNDSGSSTITDTTYTFSNGRLVTIGSSSYNEFVNTHQSYKDSSYWRKGSGLYYTTYDLTDITGPTNIVAVNFLRDNVALNATWSESFSATFNAIPGTVKVDNIILAKGVSATVNTISSTDVIKVRSTFSFTPLLGSAFPVLITEGWYARGIGLIYGKIADPLTGSVTEETKIRRYVVVP